MDLKPSSHVCRKEASQTILLQVLLVQNLLCPEIVVPVKISMVKIQNFLVYSTRILQMETSLAHGLPR